MNDLKFTTAGEYVDSMPTVFDDLMYKAGMTAQGCWDEFDDYQRGAILQFAELIVRQSSTIVQDCVDHRIPASEYPQRLKDYFGVV